ncbi:hypothetical protein BFX14_17640 [Vibrio cholerae]|nr:hypothetical protein BFX14_14725 [Vibrio cholerae]OFI73650.1 hypothetical protein BFX14_17640 [Vibrio cholerae]OFJ28104.1 hypothetical protein BFX34_18740 [Vibrio cholerae]
MHNLAFELKSDADLVERVESSVASKSLKANSLDASRLLDVPHGKLGFTNGWIIAVIALSLMWIL